MRSIWDFAPLARIAISFSIGIVLGKEFLIIPINVAFVITISIFAFSIIFIKKNFLKPFGFLFFSLWILLGNLCYNIHNQSFSYHIPEESNIVYGRVVEVQKKKLNAVNVLIHIEIIDSIKMKKPIRVQAFLPNDSLITYGRQLSFLANKISLPSKNILKGGFDYKSFLKLRYTEYTVFLKKKDYSVLSIGYRNKLYLLAYELKDAIESKLKTVGENTNYQGIAEALVIGKKEQIDENTFQDFKKTGTLHLLAISGLHTGIVYVGIWWLLFPFRLLKPARKLSIILSILLLWGFALLTGLSSSVCRASVLLSVYQFAKIFNLRTSIFNTLSFAGLVLLLANPNQLFSLGFQLSFVAVIGLVFGSQVFNRLFSPANKVVNYFYSLMVATLSAQIAVLPLVWYHFQEFPLYFLPANIIAIPLITLSTLSVFLYTILSLSFNSLLIDYFLIVINFILKVTTNVLTYFSNLRLSTYYLPNLNFLSYLLLSLFLIVITYTLIRKSKLALAIGMIVLGCFCLSLTISIKNKTYEYSKPHLMVYQSKPILFVPTQDSIIVLGDTTKNLYNRQIFPFARFLNYKPSEIKIYDNQSIRLNTTSYHLNNNQYDSSGNQYYIISKKGLLPDYNDSLSRYVLMGKALNEHRDLENNQFMKLYTDSLVELTL
jgi:competence protein ComEC